MSEIEVKKRQERDGMNKLPEKKKTPEIIKFLREISNMFAILLWVAAALSFLGYGLVPIDPSNVIIN